MPLRRERMRSGGAKVSSARRIRQNGYGSNPALQPMRIPLRDRDRRRPRGRGKRARHAGRRREGHRGGRRGGEVARDPGDGGRRRRGRKGGGEAVTWWPRRGLLSSPREERGEGGTEPAA